MKKKIFIALTRNSKKTHIVLFQNNVATQTLSRHQLTHTPTTHKTHTKAFRKDF